MLVRQCRAAARGGGICSVELSRFQVGSTRADGPQGQEEPLLEQQQGQLEGAREVAVESVSGAGCSRAGCRCGVAGPGSSASLIS